MNFEALIHNAPVDPSGFASAKAEIALAFLPGALRSISFEPAHIDRAAVIEAMNNLSQLPPSLMDELEERLFAFYTQEIGYGACDFANAQAQLDWESEATGDFTDPIAAERAADIWPLVRFQTIGVRHVRDRGVIVRIEGLAAWNGESGVVLIFDNGQRLADITDHAHAAFL